MMVLGPGGCYPVYDEPVQHRWLKNSVQRNDLQAQEGCPVHSASKSSRPDHKVWAILFLGSRFGGQDGGRSAGLPFRLHAPASAASAAPWTALCRKR